MKTTRVETKIYIEHAYCECGGEFKSVHSAWQRGAGPTLYCHICDKCDKVVDLDKVYPCLVYEEVGVKE
jgi:hypothetical protein